MSDGPIEPVSALAEERGKMLRLQEAIEKRLENASREERLEIEALSKRAVEPQCAFDRKHCQLLYTLALFPESVGWYWKLRERIHRMVHHH